MKVTFEIPQKLVRRLQSQIPCGERSRFVAGLIISQLRNKDNSLKRAANKANTLRGVNRDMKDWKATG